MPIYPHRDRNTGKEVEILRPFDKYDDSPEYQEAIDQGFTEEEAANADWEKVIGRNIKVTRGDNWKGSKGNW